MAATTVYDSKGCKVDLRRMRMTQLPTNRRVIIPEQQGPELEQHLQHLKARLEQATESYIEQECNNEGQVKESILDMEEKKALNSYYR